MCTVEDNVDINSVFEKLLFAEESAEQRGFNEGYNKGNNDLKGYHLGYHRASILAAKLGYYDGIVQSLINNQSNESSKTIDLAEKLHQDIINFPKTNDINFDTFQKFDIIKFKFTKLCSLAKINSNYPEADHLDF